MHDTLDKFAQHNNVKVNNNYLVQMVFHRFQRNISGMGKIRFTLAFVFLSIGSKIPNLKQNLKRTNSKVFSNVTIRKSTLYEDDGARPTALVYTNYKQEVKNN